MMSNIKLILKELIHRRVNAALSLAALTIAVAICISIVNLTNASRNETKRITRDIGFNLRIIPREADVDLFWAQGYCEQTMPESAIDKLADYEDVFLSYNHLVGSLQKAITVKSGHAILTGMTPTIAAKGKKPMGYSIANGQAILGHRFAARLQLSKEATLELGDQKLTIKEVLIEKGNQDDIRIYTSLSDAQSILNLPGQINEIKAIDCLCLTTDQNPLETLRTELDKALPEAQVFQAQSMADARAKQRQMSDRYFNIVIPILLLGMAAWIAILGDLNVRERRAEIGLMRALGGGTLKILSLFVGRAIVLGLGGGLIGYFMGSTLTTHYGPQLVKVTKASADPSLLIWALLWTPLFSALVLFPTTMKAVVVDPARTLTANT